MPNKPVLAGAEGLPKNSSLIDVIASYRSGWQQYLSSNYDNAQKHYEPALGALRSWDAPAQTREEAIEALKLGIEFYDAGDTPVIPAMMRSALAFLSEGKRS